MATDLTRRELLKAGASGLAAGAALGGVGVGGYKLYEAIRTPDPHFVDWVSERPPTADEVYEAQSRYEDISIQEHDGRGVWLDAVAWDESVLASYDDGSDLLIAPLAGVHNHSYAVVGPSGPILLRAGESPANPHDTDDIRITFTDLEEVPLVSFDIDHHGNAIQNDHHHPALETARASDIPLAHSYTHSRGYWTCVGTCLVWAGTRPLIGAFCGGAYWACRAGQWYGCTALAACVGGSLAFCLWHC